MAHILRFIKFNTNLLHKMLLKCKNVLSGEGFIRSSRKTLSSLWKSVAAPIVWAGKIAIGSCRQSQKKPSTESPQWWQCIQSKDFVLVFGNCFQTYSLFLCLWRCQVLLPLNRCVVFQYYMWYGNTADVFSYKVIVTQIYSALKGSMNIDFLMFRIDDSVTEVALDSHPTRTNGFLTGCLLTILKDSPYVEELPKSVLFNVLVHHRQYKDYFLLIFC